jgi:protein-S-isoprenylcysteine O-methyltransferase
VATTKKPNHCLVTTGVYARLRHPSYTAFFYFTVASMVLIGNFVSAVLFACMLSCFFEDRIRVEELHLLEFFGKDYQRYMSRTYVLIPVLPDALQRFVPIGRRKEESRNIHQI